MALIQSIGMGHRLCIVKSEIGIMLPSSFDGKEWNDLTFEEQIHGPPEYSHWEERNS